MIRLLAFLSLAMGLVLVAPSAADAQPAHLSAEVFVILARNEPGPIAPELQDMPALRRPPFSNFRSLALLSRERLGLSISAPREIDLPNGRRLRIALEAALEDGRHRIRVSILRPGQSDYLPLLLVVASPGDPFFVAGQQHEGGTLVIGIRIVP